MVDCSAFDEYTVCKKTGERLNVLKESLQLFKDCWVNRWLRPAQAVLFLNKMDVLKSKIDSQELSEDKLEEHFPGSARFELDSSNFGDDAVWGLVNVEYLRVKMYIKSLFVDVVDDVSLKFGGSRICYTHFTTVIDESSVNDVFNLVNNIICRNVFIQYDLK